VTEAFISVRDVRKVYDVRRSLFGGSAELHAAAGVSFEIPEGTTFGLVGESGSGKTTVAKMVMAAEKPTAGTIRIAGRELSFRTAAEELAFRRLLQPVLQDPYSSLSPRLKVGSIIDEPLRIHRVLSTAERKARVAELLDLVGLPKIMAQRYPHELSGGQRQRVAIARALSLKPKCLVLDEPVSALDVSIQAQILKLLKDLQDEFKLTYLLISHDLAVVSYMSKQVGVMYLGQIVEIGPQATLLSDPRHPYTFALLAAASTELERDSVNIVRGEIPSPLDPPPGCPYHIRCPLARDRCRSEKPKLREVGSNRLVACHFAETSKAEFENVGSQKSS
jgi:peptide/nickel transport system ATP-binding protein/oligopeptide transport system ATP-binding protein